MLNADQQRDLIAFIQKVERLIDQSADMQTVSAPQQPPQSIVDSSSEIQVGDLYFSLDQRLVCVRGQKIDLTAKEFDALHLLLTNHKRVMTFETISYHVWGEDYIDVTDQAIHNLISRLRQKLQIAPDVPAYIKSVRGIGYKFESG